VGTRTDPTRDEPVLVLGATGRSGRRLVEMLRGAGAPVRAASRSGDVRFDWSDPATWEAAVAGVTRMYLMAPDGVPVDPAFVSGAVEAGTRRIVLLSSGAIEAMGDERLIAAERTVRESSAEWTIVRASWFNQNFDEGFFHPAVMAGEVALPVGDVRQAFVDADDIAAVAAAALTEDGHSGRSYEVTGPQALSFADAVDIIANAAGRPVRFVGTAEAYADAMSALGVPGEQTQDEIESFAGLRRLGDQGPTGDVRQVTGREPKDFESYAAEAAARGAWSG
jgi:uncharacterized protein YbjT (DUF2867 family)